EAATFARPPASARQTHDGLEVHSIAKSYDKRAVLHDVSLDVHRGEVVGLLGPNGAGKTTCFYSVMGLVKPDSGRIYLDGNDITELVRELTSREIGVLITDHNVRETLDIVDRACIIYDGQVLFAGTPEALVADQEVRRLYLGESFAL